MTMKDTTLCYLLEKDRILLAMKKRGFGAGRWNGCGGKLEPGETVRAAACREAREEIGVEIAESGLEAAADITFRFAARPEWDLRTRVFLAKTWRGNPAESEEMRPAWFSLDALPFKNMWADDPFWLPQVLAGKKLAAEFHFGGAGDSIKGFAIREARLIF